MMDATSYNKNVVRKGMEWKIVSGCHTSPKFFRVILSDTPDCGMGLNVL